jgi:hypothetical protein
MTRAVNDLDLRGIPDEVLPKFGVADREALRTMILNNINTIFTLR